MFRTMEAGIVMSSWKGAQFIWGNPGGLGIWNGEGMGRGRSVYEQPGAKADGIASRQRRDSK